MKMIRGFSLFILVTICMLAVLTDARARDKGRDKDKGEKDKKKNEQAIEKEGRDKDNASDKHGTHVVAGESRAAKGRIKYKPLAMTSAELMEWSDGNPPGWSRGKKTGWRGAGAPPGQMKQHEQEILPGYPPGSDDWDTKRRAAWDDKLQQSEARILERIRNREGTAPEDEGSAIVSIERAARSGVPLGHVEATVDKAITRGMRGREIEKMTRAMSYRADEGTDYRKLSRFVEKKMDEGEAGDDLALSIYKEIDEQHAAKPETPVKKSWWKRIFGR